MGRVHWGKSELYTPTEDILYLAKPQANTTFCEDRKQVTITGAGNINQLQIIIMEL